MIVAHKTAIIARLGVDEILATCGYEGVVPRDSDGRRPERYWTIHIPSPVRGSDRLGGLPIQGLVRFWIHWVGRTPDQAQRLADLGVPLLAGHQLVVPGYAPHRIRHDSSQPADLDETERPPLHLAVDAFSVHTQPA